MSNKERKELEDHIDKVSQTITHHLTWPLAILLTGAVCLPVLWLLLKIINWSVSGILSIFI